MLAAALVNVSGDLLAQPATKGPPSLDGKISGIVDCLPGSAWGTPTS